MKLSNKINYGFPLFLTVAVAACDNDGDKGAVWGTDKQSNSGSAISTGKDDKPKNYSDSISIPPADTVNAVQSGYSKSGGTGTGKENHTPKKD